MTPFVDLRNVFGWFKSVKSFKSTTGNELLVITLGWCPCWRVLLKRSNASIHVAIELIVALKLMTFDVFGVYYCKAKKRIRIIYDKTEPCLLKRHISVVGANVWCVHDFQSTKADGCSFWFDFLAIHPPWRSGTGKRLIRLIYLHPRQTFWD